MRSKKVYLIATVITISVLIFNQLFIQYWLYQKKEDANTINISGRQRMLSQRLVALTLSFRENPKEKTKIDLDNAYALWADSHQLLLNQFDSKDTKKGDEIYNKLAALSNDINTVKTYIESPVKINQVELVEFINTQNSFLVKMDAIVKDLENESEDKLLLVVIIEIIFFIISLLLIVYEIVFIFRKITANLQGKNKELKESNELLEQFAYLAAHDLKSPSLNAYNFTKVLKEKLDDRIDDKEKLYFDLLMKSTRRLNETTNDLLQFSSINNEGVKIVSFSPKEELELILVQLDGKIKENDAQIILDEHFPSEIKGDKYLLGLVFQNLISNAIKFVSPEKKLILNINYQYKGNKHLIIFRDNGIGIAEKDFNKIFGLFKRLHRQDEYEGTGIGLAICSNILQKHKGEILLDSIEGEGSTFTIVLPRI